MSLNIENLTRRCPRLGGPVQFSYCRSCSDSAATCDKILDCWWERFDVVNYLKARMAPDELRKLVAVNPKPKLGTLLELIAKAQNNLVSSDQ